MEYRVDISIPALEDAETAFLWIKDFNIEAANGWFKGLFEAVFSLEDYPHRCAKAPESIFLGKEVKQLIYGKGIQVYRILFEVMDSEKVVRIYRIWHSSRDWITKEEFEEGKPTK